MPKRRARTTWRLSRCARARSKADRFCAAILTAEVGKGSWRPPQHRLRLLVKNPVERMYRASSSCWTAGEILARWIFPEQAGVTMFKRLSVNCAERIVATAVTRGLECSKRASDVGIHTSRPARIFLRRPAPPTTAVLAGGFTDFEVVKVESRLGGRFRPDSSLAASASRRRRALRSRGEPSGHATDLLKASCAGRFGL